MNDALLLAMWLMLVLGAIGFCVAARRAGVAATHLRNLVHVGAGLWPLGWAFWHDPAAPVTLALAGAGATFAVPALAGRARALASFRDSIADGDERWSGVQVYGVTFAAATALAFVSSPFAPAAALLALALGDGVGGAVGRRFGRRFFAVAGGKRKSLEGSAAVALLSAAAVALAAHVFSAPIPPLAIAAAGLLAAVAEAVSPAASDNAVLPAAVWAFLALQGA